jgi:uncharacterized membrane protein
MAPLVVLIVVFVITLAGLRLSGRGWQPGTAGCVAAAVMFVFTGVSHFLMAEGMAEMVPPGLGRPFVWVWITGVLEILGGVGLLVPGARRAAAWCLTVFLMAVFPANVYAAMHGVGLGGHVDGPGYLLMRAPLQLVFVGWVVCFGLVCDRRADGLSDPDA